MRAWIRAASWLVPSRERAAWRARWMGRVDDWRLLADRGEPVAHAGPLLLRRALAEAVHERFGPIRFPHFARSAVFVPIAIGVALLLIAVVSHGFAVTRGIVAVAQDMRVHPQFPGRYDPRGDQVVKFLAPTMIAWAVGIAILWMGSRWLRGSGWRYWGVLALKAVGALILVTLIFVEIGTLLRMPIHREGWRIVVGLAMTVAFVAATGRAMLWTVADQRQRCPRCLRRLVLPSPVGSWASLFEPPVTEFLCEDGHGSMALSDVEANGQDRWTRLDESWKAMFG
jgi:hypothetical protein